MPLRRLPRGRVIERTRRCGSNNLVLFRSEPNGSPGPRLLRPPADYLTEVRTTFHPGRLPNPASP